ncbi:uncharacterized protein EDB91DRAFT_1121400 [Suillus paluster]|uniref:uncharacterized protein n=1 Tax=Suillus paluster TaxID=48578 RepID=UPI001B86300B|nr:uncharacterized protein EDB91DRAFT_1121400 [Suillus paluster]KAG1745535.1 hypothetical protein EDB91DRAFT_1121400 [Suillus paluster]
MQEVLDYFDSVVYNDLPAHLIYVPEMRLINRADIFGIVRPHEVIHNQMVLVLDSWTAKARAKATLMKHLNYAIFSHRWLREGEPTFADMQTPAAKTGPGFEKLARFCEKAKEYDCIFAWSDTCCIDKSSSADLDEAIRSMFKWYRNAFICIVHLATSSSLDDLSDDPWFTRGWTLQELLAPEQIKFYGTNWISLTSHLNDKDTDEDTHTSIMRVVSKVTSIPFGQLMNFQPRTHQIAMKMSWAAMRRTTRIEDTAYSLMGIFDVSITIAYGERERAFFRLLQAVVEGSRQGTWEVLAWLGERNPYCHSLPKSPVSYKPLATLQRTWSSGQISQSDIPWAFACGDPSLQISPRGVEVNVLLVECTSTLDESNLHHVLSPTGTAGERDDSYDETVAIQSDSDRLALVDEFALGVLDFWNDDMDEGLLKANQEYICLFLGTGPTSTALFKVRTNNIITLKVRRDVRSKLTKVWLA